MNAFRKDDIFSAQHLPSWLMLTFAAGVTNAVAFAACARFVTHVTGTVTQIGMEVVACFLGGATLSGVLINGRARRGLRPMYRLPLFVVTGTTALLAIAGQLGLLGAFGGAVDEGGDFVLLSALSFASGLQNASVATTTGMLVRTTHLTGPSTDLGLHLAEMIYARGDARRDARRHAILRGGKIAAFAVGAATGIVLAHAIQFLAFLVPAAVVLAATLRSFADYSRRSAAPQWKPAPSPTKHTRSPCLMRPARRHSS